MGAIGYLQNGLFRFEGANKAKVELMKYILEKIIFQARLKLKGRNIMSRVQRNLIYGYSGQIQKPLYFERFFGVLGPGSMPHVTLVTGYVTQ